MHYNSLYTTGGDDVPDKFGMHFSSFYSYILFIGSEVLSNNKLIFYLFNEFTDVPSRVPRKKFWLF